MTYCFYVVAIGVTHEGSEIAGVIGGLEAVRNSRNPSPILDVNQVPESVRPAQYLSRRMRL